MALFNFKCKNVFTILLFLYMLCEMLPVIPEIAKWMICFWAIFLYSTLNGVLSKDSYKKWIICVLLFFLISCVWAMNIRVAGWVIVRQLLPQIIMLIGISGFLKREDGLYSLLRVYFACTILFFIYVCLHVDLLSETYAIENGMRFGTSLNEDAEDPLWNGNSIALLLCYGLISGYILYFKKQRGNLGQILFILIGVLYVAVILLTGSRKGLILLVLPLCVFQFRSQSFNMKQWIFVLIALMALYYAVMNIPLFYNVVGTRMEDLFNILSGNDDGTEDVSRKFLILYGIQWFLEHPILGVGINNFRVLSNSTPMFAGKNFYAHNNYIELLVDVGIIGFLIYYSYIVYIMFKIRRDKTYLANWIYTLMIIQLFLGTALVTYYDFFCNVMIVISFHLLSVLKIRNILMKIGNGSYHN